MTAIVKVISGGQTGVDIAALWAAKALGFQTGGMMPKGWRTRGGDGLCPGCEACEAYAEEDKDAIVIAAGLDAVGEHVRLIIGWLVALTIALGMSWCINGGPR
jgi:hypothetical protein